MKTTHRLLLLTTIGSVTCACQGGNSSDGPPASATFSSVSAVFAKNCVGCHTGAKAKEGIDLNTYASVMKGGREGAIITAGEPEKSVIIMAMRGKGKDQMPPAGPLAEEQIKVVEDWIRAGAKE
jgi:mono/diheme cytochrome c family protein